MNNLDDLIPIGEPYKIQFSVMKNETIKIRSAVNVTEKEGFKANLPYKGGISDAHMGTTDLSYRCDTCRNKKGDCLGHNGGTELGYNVPTPIFKDYAVKWLKIICFGCGNPVLYEDKDFLKITFEQAVKKISTLNTSKNVICKHCGEPHPHVFVSKVDTTKIMIEYFSSNDKNANKEKEIQLFSTEIKNIFEKISDEVVMSIVGDKYHPRDLIWDICPILSNTGRPNITASSGQYNDDDTTVLVRDTVKVNNILEKYEPSYDKINKEILTNLNVNPNIESDRNNLNLIINTMIMGGSGAKGKKKLVISHNNKVRSLKDKITGKPGLFRGHIMGKRVSNMGRSVISGDPTLQIDEIGVPIEMAIKLYKKEIVHEHNINRLNIYYKNGSKKYPGSFKVKHNGNYFMVDRRNKKFPLEVGDKLVRMLVDGDRVSFNRPPTLLYSSISSHRIVVKGNKQDIGNDNLLSMANSKKFERKMDSDRTLSLNPLACIYYNADFDGDAMTILIPSTIETSTETEMLSGVDNWTRSWKDSNLTAGFFHDSLIGCYEMTQSDTRLDKYHAMYMVGRIADATYEFKNQMYTGRDMVQFTINNYNINYKARASFYKQNWNQFIGYKEDDINVLIKNGKYISGVLDKRSVGKGARGSIVDAIFSKYGAKEALAFTYRLQQLTNMFMSVQGFTFSLEDITLPKDKTDALHKITDNMIADANDITNRLNAGKIVPPIGTTIEEQYEEEQKSAIRPGDEYDNIILSGIDFKKNNFIKLLVSGSKGSLKHLINITSAVGSQEIKGNRMTKLFGYERTLPYFQRFETTPESRGLIINSYNDGLNVAEYIFNTMDGRYALVNRSLGTAETGHKNRETIKNLESVLIDYNRHCARHNKIVQLAYGDNAVDSAQIESVNFPTIFLGDSEMEKLYHTKASSFKKFNNKQVQSLLDNEFKQLIEDRDLYRKTFLLVENNHDEAYLMSNSIYMPFNISRIIFDTTENFNQFSKVNSDFDPVKAINMINTFCEKLPYIYYNSYQEKNNLELLPHDKTKTIAAEVLIRSYLNTSNMIRKKINIPILDNILRVIRATYMSSLIGYGKSVGILTSQSLCEPMSQHILDSHHRAGMASAKTDFLKRIRELFSTVPKEKMDNPSMTLYVKKQYEESKTEVSKICNLIEMIQLKRFLVDDGLIFFEKFGEPVHSLFKHEKSMIQEFIKHSPTITIPGNLSKWCIRYELDKFNMISKNMDLMTIITSLRSNRHLFVVHNQEHSKKIIIRIYIKNTLKAKDIIDYKTVRELSESLKEFTIRGVPDIQRAYVIKVPRTIVNSDNGIEASKKDIYAIKTMGINYKELLFNPYIDTYNLHSDCIADTQLVYGLNAGRNKLINELRKTIPNSNISNYMLLADELFSIGIPSKISHYGLVERYKNNTLLQLSDSRPYQVLQKAAIRSGIEPITGLSAPICLGSVPKVGSTFCQIAIDEDILDKEIEDNISIDSIINGL